MKFILIYLLFTFLGMLVSKDGWVHTGDIGSLHDGYLKVFGRKSNMMKRGTRIIYLVVVEKTIK